MVLNISQTRKRSTQITPLTNIWPITFQKRSHLSFVFSRASISFLESFFHLFLNSLSLKNSVSLTQILTQIVHTSQTTKAIDPIDKTVIRTDIKPLCVQINSTSILPSVSVELFELEFSFLIYPENKIFSNIN